MKLVAASREAPKGFETLITDLGSGENGFGGTPVQTGEMTLQEYLIRCTEMSDISTLRPGKVPSTVFWLLDESEEAIGIARVRHYLSDALKRHGGHVGYYVRRDKRGLGYGRAVLRLALKELVRLGQERALITVDEDNLASRRVIESQGGKLNEIDIDENGKRFCRYWIDLVKA